jgi:hypothetical protein
LSKVLLTYALALGTIWPMRRLFSSFMMLLLGGSLLLAPAIVRADDCADGGGVTIGSPITGTGKQCLKGDPANGGVIVTYLKTVLQFLSGAIGVVVLLMFTIAGIQYITSAGEPKQITAAKERLVNAVIALVLFAMAAAILNFVVPGGIV